LTGRLEALGREEGAPLWVALFAAFAALLSRYTGQPDAWVGVPFPGRRPGQEDLIGPFARTLPLRADARGNPPFRAFLARVQAAARGADAHRAVPAELLRKALRPGPDPEQGPAFPVTFALREAPPPLELPGLIARPLEVGTGAARHDLGLELLRTPAGLAGTCEYNTDRFDAPRVLRMVGHYRTLLEGVAADPGRRLGELPLLTEAERRHQLVDWNRTGHDYPGGDCVHHLFEEQARRRPDAVAVHSGDRQVTYAGLNRRANRLADRLRNLGVGPDVLVGVFMERSPEVVVAVLAVLKAGGAYLPLDPAYPPERLALVLEHPQLSLLLAQGHLAARLPAGRARVLTLDDTAAAPAGGGGRDPASGVTPDNLAYAITTSGSTGRPKAVLLQHRGLVNAVWHSARACGIDGSARVFQFASPSFDVSVWEIFTALTAGAALCLVDLEEGFSEEGLLRQLRQREVTVAFLMGAVLSRLPAADLPALATVVTGGEGFSGEMVKRWAVGRRFTYAYGPTEATILQSYHECRADDPGEPASIGRPMENLAFYLLDRFGQPVPAGVVGELSIGGVGLARGYLNQPDLTAERFLPDPFGAEPGGRLYRSGDLARRRPDDQLDFLGRVDFQVKLRGFRIDLQEVEAALLRHPAVRAAAVLVREDTPGDRRLVAYLVAAPGAALAPGELRRLLAGRLPRHVVPSAFVPLDALPLTPNGKVDRRALPAPDPARRELDQPFVAPREDAEARLARIWGEVLGLERVGLCDDFFELGGDSLLAVRLLDRVGHEFGTKLRLSALQQGPTVEQQARLLGDPRRCRGESALVPLRPGGRRPLFLPHALTGELLIYRELIKHLDADQPVYGFQAPAPDGGLPVPTLEDLAVSFLRELREVQPEGPYLLSGFSYAGILAYELARQLAARGERVGLLAVLDIGPPPGPVTPLSVLAHLLRYFPYWLTDDLLRSNPAALFGRVHRTLRSVFRKFGRGRGASRPELRVEDVFVAEELPERFRAQSAVAVQTYNRYSWPAYPGKVTLFRARKQPLLGFETLFHAPGHDLGWGRLAAGVEVHVVPGNHSTMMEGPNARLLARRLQSALDAAAPAAPPG
jgi:amino acid adenylation domain-containing protein